MIDKTDGKKEITYKRVVKKKIRWSEWGRQQEGNNQIEPWGFGIVILLFFYYLQKMRAPCKPAWHL